MTTPADSASSDDLYWAITFVGGGALLFALGLAAGVAGERVRTHRRLDEELEEELYLHHEALARRDRREVVYRRGTVDVLAALGARAPEPTESVFMGAVWRDPLSASNALKQIVRDSGYDESRAMQSSIQNRLIAEDADTFLQRGWAEKSGAYLFLTRKGYQEGLRLLG